MTMETLFFLVPAGAALALLFAFIQARRIQSFPEGNEAMIKISTAIREGANAYLKRQYTGVAVVFAVMFAILGILALADFVPRFVPFTFLSGGFFSALAGYVGMKVATNANARTAQATSDSLNKGLRVAFSSGTVMGFVVVGLGILVLAVWFFLLKYVIFTPDSGAVQALAQMEGGRWTTETAQFRLISSALLTLGMGTSIMALFARVGGGIFTKAADVGADLVGKVEAGIPEDDPRNPAVIADNVGDNVGDVAGMGADLYESYVVSIIATVALAVSAGFGLGGALAPMLIAVAGVVASLIGSFFVRCKEDGDKKALLDALRRGTYVSSGLIILAAFPVIHFTVNHIGVYVAVLSGLFAGVAIGTVTEYYTSDAYKPTKNLAATSLTGPATLVIGGLSLGMLSTFFPIIIVCVSVMISFFVSGGAGDFAMGLYGVAISAVGMLSTLGITLATDAYGPVADNAGGIAEMSGLPPHVRTRTDALDSIGNTTAATGKGFAIGSAGLTSLALIVAYIDEINMLIQRGINPGFELNLSIIHPPVLIGLFIGAVLPFLFAALTMNAVGRAAQSIVTEVRRQFREIKGLMEGTAEADYGACVDICTRNAQKEMVLPTMLGVIPPILVGLILGVNGVAGMLAGATASGFILAIFMANSGGAWDNAKKYIEAGHHGGKKSESHKAAVVGDTIGDPFKDTSGPSINNLIKLLSTVSIVFAALVLRFSLF